MKQLAPPDSHFLSAAMGWLELGNSDEARQELSGISPRHREHPDVLEVLWSIAAKEMNWEECCDIARALIRVAPKRPSGRIHLSYALHELKRSQEAWENLIDVIEQYPRNHLICYNLACYACQLGRPNEALRWLKKAMSFGGKEQIRALALNDPDLKPLRTQIHAMGA
jgi:predicted Zn-dependent protease